MPTSDKGSRVQANQNEKEEHRADKHQPPTGVQPVEPEDPALTGGGHSSQKDALEHNVKHGHARQHPESPAGQHATGSFTEKDKASGK
jgi:hypothetical protein